MLFPPTHDPLKTAYGVLIGLVIGFLLLGIMLVLGALVVP